MSEIKHQWNGTILTVISDSGASSADLVGPKGDTGPRGPQGPGGVIYNEDGEVVIDLSEYYTKTEVDDKVANVEVDLSGYATKVDVVETVANEMVRGDYATKAYIESQGYATEDYVDDKIYNEIQNGDLATESYVSTQIAKAQLAEVAGDVDLSGFATKDDLNNIEVKVDGTTLVSKNGVISTALGGGYIKDSGDGYLYFGTNLSKSGPTYFSSGEETLSTALVANQVYNYRVITDLYTRESAFTLEDVGDSIKLFDVNNGDSASLTFQYVTSNQSFELWTSTNYPAGTLHEFAIWVGDEPSEVVPINGRFIPVDGVTITINELGQLTVIGSSGEGLASSEEEYY